MTDMSGSRAVTHAIDMHGAFAAVQLLLLLLAIIALRCSAVCTIVGPTVVAVVLFVLAGWLACATEKKTRCPTAAQHVRLDGERGRACRSWLRSYGWRWPQIEFARARACRTPVRLSARNALVCLCFAGRVRRSSGTRLAAEMTRSTTTGMHTANACSSRRIYYTWSDFFSAMRAFCKNA